MSIADFKGLKNKVVLITGGTKGVGKGIAEAFLDSGANVIVCARSEPDTPIEKEGSIADFHQLDVRDPVAVTSLIDRIVSDHGSIDVLINNAGGSPKANAATASPRFSQAIINLNLMAPLFLAQAANIHMQKQAKGGCIINIASVSGTRPSPGTAAYGAAKAGLLNLTQSLAMEWGAKVRVNAIVAGLIITEKAAMHYGGEEEIDRIGKMLPLDRMATPKDIANACLYLASEMSSYISGASLEVHGGGEWPSFLDLANGA